VEFATKENFKENSVKNNIKKKVKQTLVFVGFVPLCFYGFYKGKTLRAW